MSAAADLAARLEVLADGVEATVRRASVVLGAASRTKWNGPHRDRVEAELAGLGRAHRALADELRAAASALRAADAPQTPQTPSSPRK